MACGRSRELREPSDTRLSQGQAFCAERLGAGASRVSAIPNLAGVDVGLPTCGLLRLGISGSMGDQVMSEDFWLGLGLLMMGAWGGLRVAWQA